MELTLDQALQKGVEAHKSGNAQEADRYYTAILNANPKHPDANHNMGVLAVGVGKVEKALPFFKTALEVNPNVTQFWLSYIDALIKLDRMDDAKAAFDQAKGNDVKGDAFDELEEQIKLSNNPSTEQKSYAMDPPQRQLQTLVNLYNQGQYQKTLSEASQLLIEFPDSITLFNIIGAANHGWGKLDKAIEAYTNAISIKPDYADAYYNIGTALKEQGKLDEAIEAYKKAIFITPDYTDAYNNMGLVFIDQGKLNEAIEACTKALFIKPDYAEAYFNMGNALKDQGKLEEAIEAFNKAISIKLDFAEAYNNTGNAFQEQGKLKAAKEAYTKALSIKPDYAEAYFNMGNTLKDQGKLEEAIEAYNTALSIKPDFAEVILNASSLQNQIAGTKLINEEFNKKLRIDNLELLKMPKFQILQAISAFLLNDSKLVHKHLKRYNGCAQSSIAKLKSKDQVFCSAYNHFLQKLIGTPVVNKVASVGDPTLFHLGESHCLSYAHRLIKIHGTNYMIKPRITFGGKAYHFSTGQENAFKAITKSNFASLPDSSTVFLSFGEIDCRPNEGFISAAKKHKKPIEDLVSDTVRGYIDWFSEQNKSNNHNLFFFNVPAPSYDEKYGLEVNGEVTRTIKLFNSLLHKTVLDHDFSMIDVYKFTVGKDDYSNGLFHIDNYHLSGKAIPLIEKQIGTFV